MAEPVDVDVRMKGFRRRMEVARAQELVLQHCARLPAEPVPLRRAHGRVLARDVIAEHPVPPFRRAAMDGYAVRAEETFGASQYNPVFFDLVGEALPGRAFEEVLQPAQAVRIMTGAPVPEGADAVVMAEYAREQGRQVAVYAPVPPQKHVSEAGEDVRAGQCVLRAGRRLRPQDVGVLSALGQDHVEVVRRPKVRLVITGDELLPAGSKPSGYRIVDANSVILEGLVCRDGGEPLMAGIIPDDRDQIAAALSDPEADVVLVSGGTSVGREDHAPLIVAERGTLLVHGIAMRPSSPTGFGVIGSTLVFLLPGNPVSCLAAYELLAGPAVRILGGLSAELPHRRVRAPLRRKISSVLGRLDYVRVQLDAGGVVPLATSGASILSSAVLADGFVLVPPNSEGWAPGTEVEVYLYD